MTINLDQSNLGAMLRNQKITNYLSSTLTKTFFLVKDKMFTVFMKGSNGAFKISFPVEVEIENPMMFQVDYGKWINAVSKMMFASFIQVKVSEKSVTLSPEGSPKAGISLGVTFFDEGTSEFEVVDSHAESQMDLIEAHALQFVVTESTKDLLSHISSFFSVAGTNNAIAINEGKEVVYADRSVVYQIGAAGLFRGNHPPQSLHLHKYILGLVPLLLGKRAEIALQVSAGLDSFGYRGPDGELLVLATEPVEISIPTKEEYAQLVPAGNSTGVCEGSLLELKTALEFFTGFYEASVWKPITLIIGKEQSTLHYRHPTTEIVKELNSFKANIEASLVVSSDTLERILNTPIQIDNDTIKFSYGPSCEGVRCQLQTADSHAVDSLIALLTL